MRTVREPDVSETERPCHNVIGRRNPMLVVFELSAVADLTAEPPRALSGARVLTEYRGAGLLFRVRSQEDVDKTCEILVRLHIPPVPVLGSIVTASDWTRVIEQAQCSQPGVYVAPSQPSALPPPGWGYVPFQNQPYHILVEGIWSSSPDTTSGT
jgi:hypothetical protein